MCDANFYYNQELQDCSPCPDNLTVCQEFLNQVLKNECSRSCQQGFSTTPLTVLTTTPSPADFINKPAESFESCSALLCIVVPIAACCILALLIAAIVYWNRKKFEVCTQRRQVINSDSDDNERYAMMTAPQRAVNNQPEVTVNPGGDDSQCTQLTFKDQKESSIQDDEEHRSYCYTHKGNPICKDNPHVPVALEKGVKEEVSKVSQSHS